MAGLLERFDLMQKRPFGTNTALSDGTQYGVGGAVGSQYRRQEAAYGQALRLLNRQARRGDVRSALSAIDVRNQAMEGGYAPGGIRQKAQADAGIMGRIGAMDARNRGLEAAAQTMQQDTAEKLGVQGASGVQGATRVEGASGVQGASREGYAPTAVSRTPNEVTTAQWVGQQPNFANPQDYELSGKTPQTAIQRGTGGSNGGQWVSVGDAPTAPAETAATPSRILDRVSSKSQRVADLKQLWSDQARYDADVTKGDYRAPVNEWKDPMAYGAVGRGAPAGESVSPNRFAYIAPEGSLQPVGGPQTPQTPLEVAGPPDSAKPVEVAGPPSSAMTPEVAGHPASAKSVEAARPPASAKPATSKILQRADQKPQTISDPRLTTLGGEGTRSGIQGASDVPAKDLLPFKKNSAFNDVKSAIADYMVHPSDIDAPGHIKKEIGDKIKEIGSLIHEGFGAVSFSDSTPTTTLTFESIVNGVKDATKTASTSIRSMADSASSKIISALKRNTTASKIPDADFKGNPVSHNSKTMANWSLQTRDSAGKPFVIADKMDGKMHFFDGEGNFIESVPALFGRVPGDEGGKYQTTAGRYDAEPYASEDYGSAVRFDKTKNSSGGYNNALIHRVPVKSLTTPPKERYRALESADPADNRKTSGCINLDPKAAKRLSPYFKSGGVVYVLPETDGGKSRFSGFNQLSVTR